MGRDDQTGLPNRSIIGVLGYPLALDAASNVRAQDRMKQPAAEAKPIVSGDDPAVMTRFPKVPGRGW